MTHGFGDVNKSDPWDFLQFDIIFSITTRGGMIGCYAMWHCMTKSLINFEQVCSPCSRSPKSKLFMFVSHLAFHSYLFAQATRYPRKDTPRSGRATAKFKFRLYSVHLRPSSDRLARALLTATYRSWLRSISACTVMSFHM